MNNEIINALLTRRSVRSYKPQQVTDDELRTVLETGTYAPTSMGRQDPWIVAVQNAGLRQELTEMNAKVMGVDSDPYYGAPTIVLVFATKGARNAVQDASLALGNMMNAAADLGVASCWVHRAKEEFESEEGKAILKDLGIEGDYEGIGHLILGYAANPLPDPKPRKANYVYRA